MKLLCSLIISTLLRLGSAAVSGLTGVETALLIDELEEETENPRAVLCKEINPEGLNPLKPEI